MGHVVSSTMNEVSMAAQQIITSIFYALIPIGDSCSLTAQSFLPSILSSSVKTTKTTRTSTSSNTTTTTAAAAVRKTVKNIYKVAGVMGVFLSMIALLIPLACPLLTSDPAVIATVKSVIPVMLAVLTTHGIFCASEDILVGYRDLKFLGRIYSIFFAVVPMLMVRLKYAARMGGKAVELSSVWNVFLGYQAVRILTFASRSFYLILKTGKDSNVKSTW
jgi:Na+-driven multidrug efflux pump